MIVQADRQTDSRHTDKQTDKVIPLYSTDIDLRGYTNPGEICARCITSVVNTLKCIMQFTLNKKTGPHWICKRSKFPIFFLLIIYVGPLETNNFHRL